MLTCQVDVFIHYKYHGVCSAYMGRHVMEAGRILIMASHNERCWQQLTIPVDMPCQYTQVWVWAFRLVMLWWVECKAFRTSEHKELGATIKEPYTSASPIQDKLWQTSQYGWISEGYFSLWGGKLADICGYRGVLSWRVGSERVASLTLSPIWWLWKGLCLPMNGWVWQQRHGLMPPGGRLNKKDGLTRYGNSHVKDKTS